MKKAIDILLKIGKIVDIVAVVLIALFGVLIVPISTFVAIAGAGLAGDDPEMIAAVGALVVSIFEMVFWLVLCIVALVLLKKIKVGYAVAKNKAEVKKWAIMAIVTGALSTGVVLVAGILMLIMPEDQLPGYSAPVVEAEIKE
ncbi:MAG: hypothetical protein MJ238_00215 [Bacilli bacterium]|nr:hypothetical protein [Bacilli bacterium]